jgi:periplasmic protein TonB
MQADAKPTAVPSGTSPQPAGDPFATAGSGTQGIEASCLEVPIRALGHRAASDSDGGAGKGEPFEEDSATMLLFPRGAVIRLTAAVACGQDLMLINKQTNRYVHCRITNLRTTPEVNYVEIEFTHNFSDFWGLAYSRDAAKLARAIAAVPVQLPAESLTNAPVTGLALAPAKAMAATAGIAAASSVTMAPGIAVDNTTASVTDRPTPMTEPDESSACPQFFAPQPTVCIPVSEPVIDTVEAPATECVEAVPALQLMNQESRSVAEPPGNQRRLPAAAAVAVCAILLGYRFYYPAEAALPVVAVVAPSSTGDNLHTAGESSLAVVPAGTPDGAEPSNAIVVSAPAPEITTVDAPRQRIVLDSKMTMPVKVTSNRPPDAPEIHPTAGAEPVSGAPDGALGLLTATSSAPPPPAEEAAENHEKATDSLTPARLVSSVQPIYPPAARQAQIQGNVVIELNIDASGKVVGMKVLSGAQALRGAAMTALAQWKYQPALRDGRPTASTSVVMLRFHL